MHGQHISTLALLITSLRLEGLVDGEVGGGHGCQHGREYDDDDEAVVTRRHVHGSTVGRSLCAVGECGVECHAGPRGARPLAAFSAPDRWTDTRSCDLATVMMMMMMMAWQSSGSARLQCPAHDE